MIELGANDGMRGVPIAEMRDNLERMIQQIKSAQIDVMLGAMQLPPNYGVDYVAAFAAVYPELAEKHQIPLLPFVLDKVAGRANLNQADGIHPTQLAIRSWRKIGKQSFLRGDNLGPLNGSVSVISSTKRLWNHYGFG